MNTKKSKYPSYSRSKTYYVPIPIRSIQISIISKIQKGFVKLQVSMQKSKYPLYPRSKRAFASIRGKHIELQISIISKIQNLICSNQKHPNIRYIQDPKGLLLNHRQVYRNPNIHYIQDPKGLLLQSEANMYKSKYPLYPRSKRASASIRGKKCRNP